MWTEREEGKRGGGKGTRPWNKQLLLFPGQLH